MMYVEIADAINDKILTGVYQVGRRVPSIRLTALDFQVNHNTVIRAYDLLEREGIIQNQRGIGFSVTAEAKDIIMHKRKEWFYHELLPDVFRQMRLLGIELNEIWQEWCHQIFTENQPEAVTYFINGQKVSKTDFTKLAPDSIKVIKVLKRGTAAAMKASRDGDTHDVYMVTTK